MRTIYYNLEIGFACCNDEGTMDVPDDMTDAQIDIMIHEEALEWAQSWEGDERLGFDPYQSEEDMEQEIQSFYENVDSSWRWAKEGEE